MLKTKLLTSLLATALLAGTAVAQTSNSANPSTAAPGASTSTSSGSMGAAGSGSVQFITNEQAGQWRASKLMGVDIYGPNDEKVGDISDALVDQQGNIKAVVIGVGGFLGMGQKDVAVPFNAIQWSETPRKASTASNATGSSASGSAGGMNTASNSAAPSAGTASTETTGTVARSGDSGARTYPDHGMISMTKDQLKNAPAFDLK